MDNLSKNLNDRKIIIYLVIALLVGAIGGVFGGFAYVDKVTNEGTAINTESKVTLEEDSAIIETVKKASPAVVSITGVQQTLDFFGKVSNSESAGTGFIVTSDGLIVTNKHVVSSNAGYSVFTNDGKEYEAEVKAKDPLNDIAFLKIDGKDLPTVELGDSDNLVIGQRVIAIGNALGQYQNTVTSGIISALGRAIEAGDSYSGTTENLENVIQTDTAINSGNSGGPLLNSIGQVIGINTAIDQQGESIGFALPINLAKSAIDEVKRTGKITRPMMGVRYIPITKEFAARNNLEVTEGAYIYGSRNQAGVLSGGPAEKAGLKEGDIILKIDDYKLSSKLSLPNIMNKYKVGDKVKVTYLRDGLEKSVDLILVESNIEN